MLISSNPKRDLLSVITDQMSRPVASKGFGLAEKFDRWLAKQRQGVHAHSQETHDPWPPAKRASSPATLALLLREDTIGEEACASPEMMLQRLYSHPTPQQDPTAAWQCRGCNTTDQRVLVKGDDSTMTCSRCSVVACGVKMVSTFREKACGAEEDRTQHADAPETERDLYMADEVETAEEARSRRARDSGGCCIPAKIRQRNGIGNAEAKLRRVAAAEHREAKEELSTKNSNRNRALQIELVGLCKIVAPVDAGLQRHVRMTAHDLLVRSQSHEALCSSGCGISLAGVSAGLMAKVLLRVMAETLLPLHGRDECPFRFECSREELVGLIDRCNRLVLKEGVHSALCRTSIDILLNGDQTTPCRSDRGIEIYSESGVALAKTDSNEVLTGDAVNAVRDTIWAVSKTQTISDTVRDAVLYCLRVHKVHKWVDDESARFVGEIVALRLARAVDDKLNPDHPSQNTIVSALHRSCQRSATRMSSFGDESEVRSIVADIDFMANNDDELM